MFTRKDTRPADRVCWSCDQRIPDHESECEQCKARARKARLARINARIDRGYTAVDRVLWVFADSK
jgi:hypothetical protein